METRKAEVEGGDLLSIMAFLACALFPPAPSFLGCIRLWFVPNDFVHAPLQCVNATPMPNDFAATVPRMNAGLLNFLFTSSISHNSRKSGNHICTHNTLAIHTRFGCCMRTMQPTYLKLYRSFLQESIVGNGWTS